MGNTFEILLQRWRDGDHAAGERVFTMAYSELRRLAAHYFRHEVAGHTLQPTALVNEVFLKLCSGSPVQWQDRTHFFAVAAHQMRLILIDHSRRRNARKRQDTRIPVPLWGHADLRPQHENLLAIDEALKGLEGLDSRAARVVELRVFGGLKEAEIANVLEVSVATVKRDWNFARAWLLSRLQK